MYHILVPFGRFFDLAVIGIKKAHVYSSEAIFGRFIDKCSPSIELLPRHMELIVDPAVNGTTENKDEYPFGMHKWDIVSPDFSGSIPLNMYGCIDSEEFSCNDGACIGIEER